MIRTASLRLRSISSIVLAPCAVAQWSANPAVNTPVCVQPGDQAVTKAAAAGEGKTWIGWFDHRGSNYDVYVQLLDVDGNAVLAPNGLLVSSQPQNTSLVGWDLTADSSGACVLAFTDIRAGGDLDVYAYRISQSGQFLWGANGVALSNNADYEANPALAELSDGTFVCVWPLIPSAGTGSIRCQRLDANGNPLLGASDIALSTGTTTGEKPSFCDVVAADNGSFVVQWLRNTATFSSLRHVRAQKFDSSGAPQWNAGAPVIVFDAASVPIAYQPILQSDGAGGAVLCWHRSATLYDVFVQKLSASGAELFPHNGVQVSLEANRHKLDPSLAYLRASGDLIVVFDRRDPSQGQRGVGAQRVSASGALLWGNDGIELEAVDAVTEGFERAVPYGDGALVTYFQYPTFGSLDSSILARRLDGNGADVWSGTTQLCTDLSPKDKPQLVVDESGIGRMAWDDERADSGDVYAQNVFADGSIGPTNPCSATNYCIAAPNSAGPGALLGWSGSTSVALNFFTLSASGCPANKNAVFFYGATATAGIPFFAGFKCVASPVLRLPVLTTDALGEVAYTLDLTSPPNPLGQITASSTWHFQLWYRDPTGTGGSTNFSDGLTANFCP
jgi:hypothetical protein